LAAAPAVAQQPSTKSKVFADNQERIAENHYRYTGRFELQQGDTTLYADEAEVFRDEDRAIATGNVVFKQGANQIAADRADFNIKTRLGTFYNATGMASFEAAWQQRRAGGVAPRPMTGENAEVYVLGESI